MSSDNQELQDFESVKTRLEEIADAVSDDSLPLDEALDLFEEAVDLGLRVTDYVEEGIVVSDEDIVAAIPEAPFAPSESNVSEAPAASDAQEAPVASGAQAIE